MTNELCAIWTQRTRGDIGALSKALEEFALINGVDEVVDAALAPSFQELLERAPVEFGKDKSAVDWWVNVWSSTPIGVESEFLEDDDAIEFQEFLDIIREIVVARLSELIRSAIFEGGLPRRGLVLYFTRSLSFSFVLEYRSFHQVVEIDFDSYIKRPDAIFSIEDVSRLDNPRARSNAKTFIQSGHKAVIHNDILTHVDRRYHIGVFGPTVDTLLLSEALRIHGDLENCSRILEIGIGSGHILNSALQNIAANAEAFGIDIHARSVTCTYENIERSRFTSARLITKDVNLSIGRFDSSNYSKQFDVVVCNPPYVSVPVGIEINSHAAYKDAVSGDEMLSQLIGSAPKILSPRGRMVLMVSSTTEAFDALEKHGLNVKLLEDFKMEVPFDLEAVHAEAKWKEYLLENELIRETEYGYSHELRPMLIQKREE